MMDIFAQLRHLQTEQEVGWVYDIDEQDIVPVVLQKWLVLGYPKQSGWLDKYTFNIPPRMFLALAWSVLPKRSRAAFIRYVKREDRPEEEMALLRMRKALKLSDNDYSRSRVFLIKALEQDKKGWYRALGMPKKEWRKAGLIYDMRAASVKPKGLDAYGG